MYSEEEIRMLEEFRRRKQQGALELEETVKKTSLIKNTGFS
jgi:hypothetical protein